MANPNGRIVPDWKRVARANEPRLRRPIPALSEPVSSANEALNRVAVTLNRGGGGASNPLLSGLGIELQFSLNTSDRLRAVHVFQDRSSRGLSLHKQASVVAPGVYSLGLLLGDGRIVAGSPETGAVRNFLRVESKYGAFEKEFWVKTYDADVVQLGGENALDAETLEPVAFVATIVDATRDWIDIPIDFMVGWNDEFQVLHRRADGDVETGFLKAYGGAKFVSFFDADPGDEGVGGHVNPVNQAQVQSQHKIQVENTAGDKHIVVRFRSKKDSDFFVDVPILVTVVAPDDEVCMAPVSEPCTDLYLKHGTELPEGLPGEPSEPMVQVEEGEAGEPVDGDLLVVTVRGASVGAAPQLLVQKWVYVTSAQALAGVRTALDSQDVYLPLVSPGSSPDPGPPFGAPKRMAVAFSVVQLASENVAYLTIQIKDGNKYSPAVLVPGPKARDIQFTPVGGLGGGPVCAY